MPRLRKPASEPVETEAKIRVVSFVPVRRSLIAAGATLVHEETLETNTLFDSPSGALTRAGKSFRVRRYGTAGLMTLKGLARVAGGLKSRVELETGVSDPEALARILASLGFVPGFYYEKFREVWRLGRVLVCLDRTPLGRFVEIEGTAAAIRRVAGVLGLGEERFLSTSYPALWAESGRSGPMIFSPRRRPGTEAGLNAPAKFRTKGRA